MIILCLQSVWPSCDKHCLNVRCLFLCLFVYMVNDNMFFFPHWPPFWRSVAGYESLVNTTAKKDPSFFVAYSLCHISAKPSPVSPLTTPQNLRYHYTWAIIPSFEQEMGNCHDEPVVIWSRQKCLLAARPSEINILLSL